MPAPISYQYEKADGSTEGNVVGTYNAALEAPSHDAEVLFDSCQRLGIATDWWYPLANTIKMVAGFESNEAYLLLPRLYLVGDANRTPAVEPIKTSFYNHRIDLVDGRTAAGFQTHGWVFHSARVINPNDDPDDLDSMYLVKFVDRRFLFDRQPCYVELVEGTFNIYRTGFNIVSMKRDDTGMTYDQSSSSQFPYDLTTMAPGMSALPYSWQQLLALFFDRLAFFEDGTGEETILTDDGVYPIQPPVDIRPNNRSTWAVYCDLLHASGNEIFPLLDGTFRVLPIDDHFSDYSNDLSALDVVANYLIDAGYPKPEDRRLPELMTMTYQIRDRGPNSEATNRNKYYTQQTTPHVVVGGTDDPYLITSDEYTKGDFVQATGEFFEGEASSGNTEDVTTFGMTAVCKNDIPPDNATPIRAFAHAVLRRLILSRADSIDATYGAFIEFAPSPEFEHVSWFLNHDGPQTHFKSLSSSIGVDSLPEITGNGAANDRLVAANPSDDTPKTLYEKIEDTSTYDNTIHQLVWAETKIHGTDPNENNKVRLFTTLGTGDQGPPGDPGTPGTPGTPGADGDTVDAGYCITLETITATEKKVHHDSITASAGSLPATLARAQFQFWFHAPAATVQEDAKWNTVTGYNAALNQMWWHESGAFTFQTTGNYDTTPDQLLGHLAGGAWTWAKIEVWLSKLPGFDSTLNQIVGHVANGAIEWKTLTSTVINNPLNNAGAGTTLELNDTGTTLDSKLHYQATTVLVWPAPAVATADVYQDSVNIVDC